MKKYLLFCLSLFGLLWSIVGCSGIELPEDGEVKSAKKHSLAVTTRTLLGEPITPPLLVAAFDGEGRAVAQQTLEVANQPFQLSLPAGSYRLVALSGVEPAAAVGSEPLTLQREIQVGVPHHTASQSWMRGEAAVTLSSGKTKASLLMTPMMARVEVELTNIPAEITAVSVQFHPLFSSLSWGNAYGRPQPATLPCQQTASGSWTSGPHYVLPSSEGRTILTLSLTDAQETRHYGYTLATSLKAATPYVLRGRFAEDEAIGVDGEILTGGWNDVVQQEFEFGPAKGIAIDPNDKPTPPDEEVTTTPTLPTAGTLWNGHVVAGVKSISANEAMILLISMNETTDLSSALSTTHPNEAATIAAAYAEGTLTGWRIPTREEARFLSTTYKEEALSRLNEVIVTGGGQPIVARENNKNVRYLCEDAYSTYDFRGGAILAAGKTVKTYHLRLVKSLRVRQL